MKTPCRCALPGGYIISTSAAKSPRLADIYEGRISNQDAIDALIGQVVADHDDALLPWFDSPPQTNEAGRSANFMAALLWLSGKVGSKFELLELGASAGVNTMMARYHYNLAGVEAGPENSPMQIRPEWEGPPPPVAPVNIVSTRACDQNPINLTDDEVAARLKGYIWPEMPERFERMEAAIALAKQEPPNLVKADAADWTEAQLLEPQKPGTTRTLMHSIVWQYLPPETQNRIQRRWRLPGPRQHAKNARLDRGGTNRKTFSHEVIVRYWPDGDEPSILGHAHAHGAWVKWTG